MFKIESFFQLVALGKNVFLEATKQKFMTRHPLFLGIQLFYFSKNLLAGEL